MEATMIDKKMGEKQLQIEVSCGNAGNSIDGQLPSASKTSGNDTDSIASGNYDDGGKLLCPFFNLSGILGTFLPFWLFSGTYQLLLCNTSGNDTYSIESGNYDDGR